jgi:glycosyltransferase involved in cell wall biosynthesis
LKIFYVGDSPTVPTGFGQVSKNLLGRFIERGYEVEVMGINSFGEPYDRKQFPYNIWPCDKGPIEALYGYAKMWHIAAKVRPDIIFFLNDPWVIERYLDHKPENFADAHVKYVAYYPIDSGPLKPHWAKMLTEKFDAQVCYSHFAERIIIDANNGKRPQNLYQVYHGVDTKTYFPIVQGLARAKLGLPQEDFIVGMVARNQYRKRFDILVKAFAEFAKDKKNVRLYMHTALADVGYDILDLAQQFDLDNKLILTEDMRLPDGVPEWQLNLIYNSFDVNVLLSLGDGFGLPVAESMAVGCPQLVSDHSCLRELVDGHGGLTVKTATWLLNVSGINTWGGVPDVDDTVAKLQILYDNRNLRIKLAEDAYQFITQDKFNWDHIADQFDEIIRKTAHILPRSANGVGEGY